MKTLIHDDFLLAEDTARRLYHEHAAKMPIFDYHCHLNPREIAENRRFNSLTELWLEGDHYKWRLMRACGVAEEYITGSADEREKFKAWASAIEKGVANPLSHWTALELARYFNIDTPLTSETAEEIWRQSKEMLAFGEFTARQLILKSNVTAVFTIDDPADSLEYHRALAEDSSFPVLVCPSFRPETAVHPDDAGFAGWVGKLSTAAGIEISSYTDMITALSLRADAFEALGCRTADQSFGCPGFKRSSPEQAQAVFVKAMEGAPLSEDELSAYQSQVMLDLGKIYHKHSFVLQLHFSAARNCNSRMFKRVGINAGFDAIGDSLTAGSLSALLDTLDSEGVLPKTVVYSLNENDNVRNASILGCFQEGSYPPKLQLGMAWWFNDNRSGMQNHLTACANQGVLSGFIGMLTDSRSFLSYTRHEYFRRILCNQLGQWVKEGVIAMEDEALGRVVEDICYNNAVSYFGIKPRA
ncbi:glucuronate isomerase [Acetanaerobacterium elongatum]|uniref:Uronate isomerase n=1 Tax=Acetanaerobacterium elongatum TaxID=258515 RepID=A0A1H0C8B3_9FIRM|nr:glucuronate isomerase [Acetanaerobacterium elongatum]SDN54069.1 D-glucuronate isomerase [Acetanaerobacterium elongatum]